jgi:protein-arginine kinase activator protein McsA
VAKECKYCREEKAETEFYRFFDRWTNNHYLSARCKPCHQKYKIESPTTARNRKSEKLQLRYGLTYEQWENMRHAEDYRCMICNISEDELGKKLDVDHCHNSGKVRGVLCNPCNTMLGHARDNIQILESSVKYLKEQGGGYKS